jgi:hypothetical protein
VSRCVPRRVCAASQGRDSHLSYNKGYEYCRTGNPTRAAYEMVRHAAFLPLVCAGWVRVLTRSDAGCDALACRCAVRGSC